MYPSPTERIERAREGLADVVTDLRIPLSVPLLHVLMQAILLLGKLADETPWIPPAVYEERPS